jgi:hypothetical protein
MIIPVTNGINMVINNGLNKAQIVTFRPGMNRGNSMGKRKMVKVMDTSMKAAVRPRSPFALSTMTAKKGAQGVKPTRISP